MTFLLKAYAVTVPGYWPPMNYEGATHGQARAKAFGQYRSAFESTTYRDFMRLRVSVKRLEPLPETFGQRIWVSGRPAYRCLAGPGQYVRFVRPGATQVLSSHPADVDPFTGTDAEWAETCDRWAT